MLCELSGPVKLSKSQRRGLTGQEPILLHSDRSYPQCSRSTAEVTDSNLETAKQGLIERCFSNCSSEVIGEESEPVMMFCCVPSLRSLAP